MKISFVSSAAVSKALNTAMMRQQSELVSAQTELATLKHADVGLKLGARTAQSVSLARDIDRLKGLVTSNELVSSRLAATQDSLTRLSSAAEDFVSALTVGAGSDNERQVLQAEASNMLGNLTAVLNTSVNGEFLFSGVNTDVKPIENYDTASPAKAAFNQAFQDHFGFAAGSADANTITAGQMTGFLTTVVEPMFMGPAWNTNWSNASDDLIASRIALNDIAQTSASANNAGVRRLAMASSVVSDLMGANLNANARASVTSYALEAVSTAVSELGDVRSRLGLVESRVKAASERITMQVSIFTTSLRGLEGVDPYEASTRVNDLLAQVETSYALTARIQRLSLLDYL